MFSMMPSKNFVCCDVSEGSIKIAPSARTAEKLRLKLRTSVDEEEGERTHGRKLKHNGRNETGM